MSGGAGLALSAAAKAAVLDLRRLFQTGTTARTAAAAAAAAAAASASPCLPVSLRAHAQQHYAELAHNVSGLSATAGCDLVADRLAHLARLLAARRAAGPLLAAVPAPPAALFSQLAQGAAGMQAGGDGDRLRRLVAVVADGYAEDRFVSVPLHLAALTCHSLATLGLWQPMLALCRARVHEGRDAFAHRPAAEHTMVVYALHLEAASGGGGGSGDDEAAREACRRSVRSVVLRRLREQLADASHASPYSGPQLCFLAAHVAGAAAPAALLLVRGFGALLRGVAFRDLATLLQAPPAADVAAAVLLSDASPLRRVLKGAAAGAQEESARAPPPPPPPTAAEVGSLASFLARVPNEMLRDLPGGSGAEAVAMKYAFLAEAARGCALGEGRLAAAFVSGGPSRKRRGRGWGTEVGEAAVALRVHGAALAALQPAALAVCADAWRGPGGAAKQKTTRVLPAGGLQLLRALAPLVARVGRLGGDAATAVDLLPGLLRLQVQALWLTAELRASLTYGPLLREPGLRSEEGRRGVSAATPGMDAFFPEAATAAAEGAFDALSGTDKVRLVHVLGRLRVQLEDRAAAAAGGDGVAKELRGIVAATGGGGEESVDRLGATAERVARRAAESFRRAGVGGLGGPEPLSVLLRGVRHSLGAGCGVDDPAMEAVHAAVREHVARHGVGAADPRGLASLVQVCGGVSPVVVRTVEDEVEARGGLDGFSGRELALMAACHSKAGRFSIRFWDHLERRCAGGAVRFAGAVEVFSMTAALLTMLQHRPRSEGRFRNVHACLAAAASRRLVTKKEVFRQALTPKKAAKLARVVVGAQGGEAQGAAKTALLTALADVVRREPHVLSVPECSELARSLVEAKLPVPELFRALREAVAAKAADKAARGQQRGGEKRPATATATVAPPALTSHDLEGGVDLKLSSQGVPSSMYLH